MSTKVGAKTKAWIRNNVTGEKKSFQFNPSTLSYPRSANYKDIIAPGMAFPNTQYVSGSGREFPVDLILYDKPYTGLIESYLKFFEQFLPAEKNIVFTKPPEMTFCFGYFIRKCVMLSFEPVIVEMNDYGKPTVANISMSLRQVSV